jgi:hypothetical protein
VHSVARGKRNLLLEPVFLFDGHSFGLRSRDDAEPSPEHIQQFDLFGNRDMDDTL